MSEIKKEIEVSVDREQTFHSFVQEFNKWWPNEYTWSQDSLVEIRIDGKEDGLCSEIGLHDFRCDWGRVTEYIESEKISLKWQIGPNREPVPNPEKSSDLQIIFTDQGQSTKVELEHMNFENHGEDGEKYQQMMDSEQGWDFILNRFKTYIEEQN